MPEHPLADRHLLILDLDETLIYGTEEPLERPHDFQVGPYSVYRRPFLAEFLEQAFEWYEVAVWSSAGTAYVEGVVQHAIPRPERLRFVWSSRRCTQRYHWEERTYYWLKDLKKVKKAGYPLERVLVLDDTPAKLERHYGNLLRLPPFMGEMEDTALRDVLPFLDTLRTVENLRKIEKRFWRTLPPARP